MGIKESKVQDQQAESQPNTGVASTSASGVQPAAGGHGHRVHSHGYSFSSDMALMRGDDSSATRYREQPPRGTRNSVYDVVYDTAAGSGSALAPDTQQQYAAADSAQFATPIDTRHEPQWPPNHFMNQVTATVSRSTTRLVPQPSATGFGSPAPPLGRPASSTQLFAAGGVSGFGSPAPPLGRPTSSTQLFAAGGVSGFGGSPPQLGPSASATLMFAAGGMQRDDSGAAGGTSSQLQRLQLGGTSPQFGSALVMQQPRSILAFPGNVQHMHPQFLDFQSPPPTFGVDAAGTRHDLCTLFTHDCDEELVTIPARIGPTASNKVYEVDVQLRLKTLGKQIPGCWNSHHPHTEATLLRMQEPFVHRAELAGFTRATVFGSIRGYVRDSSRNEQHQHARFLRFVYTNQ